MARAYIETSIPSYYTARNSREIHQFAKQQATRDWWDGGCSGFELVTSTETLNEAKRGNPEQAAKRTELLSNLPILGVNSQVEDLTAELIDLGAVPKSVVSDAIHIAVSAVHEVEYLITWNFKHIANPTMRSKIREIVAAMGYRLPEMCSPDELLNYNEPD